MPSVTHTRVNRCATSAGVALLTPAWRLLLARVGDDVMLHLLTTGSLFVPLPVPAPAAPLKAAARATAPASKAAVPATGGVGVARGAAGCVGGGARSSVAVPAGSRGVGGARGGLEGQRGSGGADGNGNLLQVSGRAITEVRVASGVWRLDVLRAFAPKLAVLMVRTPTQAHSTQVCGVLVLVVAPVCVFTACEGALPGARQVRLPRAAADRNYRGGDGGGGGGGGWTVSSRRRRWL